MIFSKIKKAPSKNARKEDWSKQKQTDPPYFGQARLISQRELDQVVSTRQKKCLDILEKYKKQKPYTEGLVSIVILTCLRPQVLKRLCESLFSFLEQIENYPHVEVNLVDNNSGPELINYAKSINKFKQIFAFEENHGLAGAMQKVYPQLPGEYILFIEDDFIIDHDQPFLQNCIDIFTENPEIGIIRLKNQNNWWKPYRIIGPLRKTSNGSEFWTWLPSRNWRPFKGGELNGWAAGSVMFRKVSYLEAGEIPTGPNFDRNVGQHQGILYEEVFGKQFNKLWLAAKMKNCYPFFQPNDEEVCPGWGQIK